MTTTYTHTYSRDDVVRVYASFSADYRIVAEWTRLHDAEFISRTIAQIAALVEAEYVSSVHLQLKSLMGTIKQAAVYRVSRTATGWSSDRPGDMYWVSQSGDKLEIVIFFSEKWNTLSQAQQAAFKAKYFPNWLPSDFDGQYPGLASHLDRRYASRGYGMERTDFSP
jgi:hypothetical protein